MSLDETVSGLYGAAVDERRQRAALTDGEVPVGVYGLGKMGLPLAAVYADVTGNVTGADVDPAVVEGVNAGESHVTGEPGLGDLVGERVASGALSAETDPAAVAEDARVHVVIVPTLMTDAGDPDLSVVEAVVDDVAAGLAPGDVVFVESTVPPRTCVDRLLPRLESKSGLSLGEFGLAFCPERTSSGRALRDIRGAHPKVVGGADAESRRVARLVYDEITDNDVVPVADTTTAEAVKVFEGVYRDVNIAVANELARHAGEFGVDVTQAIEAANTQPFCDLHTPGIGVGGHCIPFYTQFVTESFETDAPLLSTAREVNDGMPAHAGALLREGLAAEGVAADEARVLVLGTAYRAGVDEIRKSPAVPLVEYLTEAGATVRVTDPVASDTDPFEAAGAGILPEARAAEAPFDAVVLVTAHEEFGRLDLPSLGPEDGSLVLVDGRQALTAYRDHPDVRYRGIGLDE